MTFPLSTATQGRAIARGRAAMAVVPLVVVNTISVVAQFMFWRAHLTGWPLIADALFAVALESIAIYVGYHAHLAQIEDDSSFGLRTASYLIGLLVGVLNGSHYLGAHGHLTAAAVGLGLLSASSPWLWSIHSRRESRDQLRARHLIEPRAVRLGKTRWLWHPIRSARVMWASTWLGVQDPTEAIALIEPRTESARAALEFTPETLGDMRTVADAIRFAMLEVARSRNVEIGALSAREITDWLDDHKGEMAEPWTITPSYVSDVLRRTIAAREKSPDNVTRLQSRERQSA
jgi:hypothetical protein